MPLSEKDYKAILEIIEIAHSTHDRSSMFKAICERLERLIGISSAAFLPIDPRTENFLFPWSSVYNVPMKDCLLFCLYYAPLHPVVERGLHVTNINQAIRITDSLPAYRLAETEYCRDFQSKIPIFYELSCVLGSQGDPIGGIGLHRKSHDKDFSSNDKEVMGLLLPHLSRAFHNINLIEQIASSGGVGIIRIGPDGNPSYINDEAKRALGGRPISLIPDPGISFSPAYLIGDNGVYRIRTIAGWGHNEKTILLEPIPSNEALTLKLTELGLTKRQQEVAILLIRGLSNYEISERLFITEQMVKDHLHDIFEKAKVKSRCQLMAKILGLDLKT